jgi:hypothetical protein
MKQNAAKTVVRITHLSIYSADGGGWNVQGFHKDALALAHQWGLLRGYPNPPFDGINNMVRVPEGKTMILHYSEEGGFMLTLGDRKDPKIIAVGTQVKQLPDDPQRGGGHTVYATDAKDFTFTFHGYLTSNTE